MRHRILWIGLWVLSALLCYKGMKPIVEKWQDSPTITSIADTNYAVWNIHFPAITICSNNKVVKKKLSQAFNKAPWNSTLFKNHFADEDNKTDTAAMRSGLKGVIRKYVFFAEDANVSEQETLIDENINSFLRIGANSFTHAGCEKFLDGRILHHDQLRKGHPQTSSAGTLYGRREGEEK